MHSRELVQSNEHHRRMGKIAAASSVARRLSEAAAASVKAEAEWRAKLKAIERKQAAVLAMERLSEQAAAAQAQRAAAAEARTSLLASTRQALQESAALTFASPPDHLSALVDRLQKLLAQARSMQAHECERLASGEYGAAKQKLAAVQRNRALVARWEQAEYGHPLALVGADEAASASAPPGASAVAIDTQTTAAAAPAAGSAIAVARQRRRPATAGAVRAAAARGASSDPLSTPPPPARPARPATPYAALLRRDLDTLSRRLGGKRALLDGVVEALPPAEPLPHATAAEMKASLRLVLHALSHNLHLEASPGELDAAKAAFKSWHAKGWLDPRTSKWTPKTPFGWSVEQYGLAGFAPLYAGRLHVPRVAAARQVMLWLLGCAPGVPTDAPLTCGDLGAGTCAALVGARIALREHGGAEQPFRAFPIEVASTGARFEKAFRALVRPSNNGAPPPLGRGQAASQYLTEASPGLLANLRSLFTQVSARGQPPPQLVLASFSLQYLRGGERDAFYDGLPSLAPPGHPFLLVVIKGVGEAQRPPPHHPGVPSVFLGIHYVIGEDRNPRVVEAHLCLVRPAAATGVKAVGADGGSSSSGGSGGVGEAAAAAEPPTTDAQWAWRGATATATAAAHARLLPMTVPSSEWVAATFAAASRRCASGPFKAVTLFDETTVEPSQAVTRRPG